MTICGADTDANTLYTSLLVGEDTVLPVIDYTDPLFTLPPDLLANLGKDVEPLTIDQLTSGDITGSGVFDTIMRGLKAQMVEEYQKNRIIGAEYTKLMIAAIDGAMSASVQFLLGKDQSFWGAQAAQIGALTAVTTFETAKMQLATAKFQALNAKADFALTKMKLSTESASYCTAQYQLDHILPLQATQLQSQIDASAAQTAVLGFNLSDMLPAQKALVLEQTESQRAQTLDTRLDGTAVTGVLGEQKLLYQQQIISYQRDAEVKATKLFTDAWITMKTIDEGLDPPLNFDNASLDDILTVIRTNNGFGTGT